MLDIHFPFLHHHADPKLEPVGPHAIQPTEPFPSLSPKPSTEVAPMSTTTVTVTTPHESLGQKIVDVEKKFISILDFVGKEAEKGLVFAVKYAVPVASLVSLIFPAAAPEATGAVVAINLIQNAVLEIKAKSAALPAGLTPAQMLADELQLVAPAVTEILAKENIKVDNAQIQKYIEAVVAILDAQPAPVA